ncbi:MAG: DUF1508 domain-containing protein [Armatimonadetes bacterium]|nr:MAG: DUF1508 domain-containing protein [Armatimonadota bacterium]
MAKIEIHRDRAGEYRLRFVALNNKTVVWSEGYKTKQGAGYAAQWLKTWASSAIIYDLT